MTVEAKNELGEIIILVSDDGPGIHQTRLVNVIKRGTRLDENELGNGLGLGIAEDIITLYGGMMILEDAAIGGLRVKIMFPLLAK